MSIIDLKDTLYVTVTLRSTSCGIRVHNDRVYKSYHVYHEVQVEYHIHTYRPSVSSNWFTIVSTLISPVLPICTLNALDTCGDMPGGIYLSTPHTLIVFFLT